VILVVLLLIQDGPKERHGETAKRERERERERKREKERERDK
jgi:hypothetical protein